MDDQRTGAEMQELSHNKILTNRPCLDARDEKDSEQRRSPVISEITPTHDMPDCQKKHPDVDAKDIEYDKPSSSLKESILDIFKDRDFQNILKRTIDESVSTTVGKAVAKEIEKLDIKSLVKSRSSLRETLATRRGSSETDQEQIQLRTDENSSNSFPHLTSFPSVKGDSTVKDFESAWRNLADKEIDDAREEGFGNKHGTHAILCVDTSASMNEGDAWSQVKRFYNDFLDGIEKLKEQDAHHDDIALVTFGRETKVQQRLTKDLARLRGKLDDITPDGPSPLFGGLVMAAAVVQTLNSPFAIVNFLFVRPKIILVTDGRPTEISLEAGKDVADPAELQKTKTCILEEAQKLKSETVDLHCIYVGKNADRSFLQSLQSETVKELMSYRDGEKMALYTVLKCAREGDQRFVRYVGAEDMGKPVIPGAPDPLATLMGLSSQPQNMQSSVSGAPNQLATLMRLFSQGGQNMQSMTPCVPELLAASLIGMLSHVQNMPSSTSSAPDPLATMMGMLSNAQNMQSRIPGAPDQLATLMRLFSQPQNIPSGVSGAPNQLATMMRLLSQGQNTQSSSTAVPDQLSNLKRMFAKPDQTMSKSKRRREDAGFTTDEDFPTTSSAYTSTITLAGDRLINVYHEIKDGKHPPIGTRVKRGDYWHWGNQDNDKAGTIIGHATDRSDNGQCWVHVEWDDDFKMKGNQNVYRFKIDDTMEGDVTVTGEDRTPPEGKVLAVGCRVKPGKGLLVSNEGKKHGVVIKLQGNQAEVRWDDGSRGKYRYGSPQSEIVPVMDPERKANPNIHKEPDKPNVVKRDIPSVEVTDKMIQKIARTIGKDWPLLGTWLDIDNVKITHINADETSTIMKISSLIEFWRRKEESPTLDVLVNAIEQCGAVYDNNALQEIILEVKEKMAKNV